MVKSLSTGAQILLLLAPVVLLQINLQGCAELKQAMQALNGAKCMFKNVTHFKNKTDSSGACPVTIPKCLEGIKFSDAASALESEELFSCLNESNFSTKDAASLCDTCVPEVQKLVGNLTGCCGDLKDLAPSCDVAFENASKMLDEQCSKMPSKDPAASEDPGESKDKLLVAFASLQEAMRQNMPEFSEEELEEYDSQEMQNSEESGSSLPVVLLIWFVAGLLPAALLANYYVGRSRTGPESYDQLPGEVQ